MATDIFQSVAYARRVEFDYHNDASPEEWFHCVLAPVSEGQDELELWYLTGPDRNTVTIVSREDFTPSSLRPPNSWSAAVDKAAEKLAKRKGWSLGTFPSCEPSSDSGAGGPKPKPEPPKAKARAKAKPPVGPTPAAEPAPSSSGRPSRVAATKAAQLAKRVAAEDDAGSEFTGSDYEGSAEGAERKDDSDDDASVSSDYDDDSGGGAKRRRGAGGASKGKAKARATPAAKGGLPTCSATAKARGSRDDGKFTLGATAGQAKGGEGGKGGQGGKPGGAPPAVVSVRLPNPPKQPVQPFVDPAGLDIEDRGVEWIVETQCEKVKELLADALAHGELDIKMATACSGTDAPVVAMRVAKEQLARRGVELPFEHVMSCEIEPYKQSFIARNNPGVLLFPDIAALGGTKRGEMATTAYGGKAAVPFANLIVAGTSCKDFSNLKGKDRKGIEAMGTSGETFIGFVNLLFEQRYPQQARLILWLTHPAAARRPPAQVILDKLVSMKGQDRPVMMAPQQQRQNALPQSPQSARARSRSNTMPDNASCAGRTAPAASVRWTSAFSSGARRSNGSVSRSAAACASPLACPFVKCANPAAWQAHKEAGFTL